MPPAPEWIRTDPAVAFGAELGVPAWTENDANLAALGEGAFGAARGMSSFLYVKMVYGLGAGIVIGGELYRGRSGLAGELGHVHMYDDGALCWCGGRGCLMTKVNPSALVELIRPVHPEAVKMEHVLTLAADGDPSACRALRDVGRTIGRSLAGFCAYMDPDGIVLDGTLEGTTRPVLEGVLDALARYAPPDIAVDVVAASLGRDAENLGAAVLVRTQQLDEHLNGQQKPFGTWRPGGPEPPRRVGHAPVPRAGCPEVLNL